MLLLGISIVWRTVNLLLLKNVGTGRVLDTMLEMQAKQRANGGPKTGEIDYDDTFICDNVSATQYKCIHCGRVV